MLSAALNVPSMCLQFVDEHSHGEHLHLGFDSCPAAALHFDRLIVCGRKEAQTETTVGLFALFFGHHIQIWNKQHSE